MCLRGRGLRLPCSRAARSTLIDTLKREFGEEVVKANTGLVKERAKELVVLKAQAQQEDDEVLPLNDDEDGDVEGGDHGDDHDGSEVRGLGRGCCCR